MQKTLAQLYQEHQGKVSDKWSIYLEEYDRIFNEYRDRSINLLEIGIQNGGSLEIWHKFFHQIRRIVGCDINPRCAELVYENPAISVVVGDANTEVCYSAVRQLSPDFDIVIDDGSHSSSDIVKSFTRYFPVINSGGIFVAEDLHCSYWRADGGGLYDPYSSISFFKRLADLTNFEHWGVPLSRAQFVADFFANYECSLDEVALAQIHSVEFVNSMCVVRKRPATQNFLGPRFVAGNVEAVSEGPRRFHLTRSFVPDQSKNPWSIAKGGF